MFKRIWKRVSMGHLADSVTRTVACWQSSVNVRGTALSDDGTCRACLIVLGFDE